MGMRTHEEHPDETTLPPASVEFIKNATDPSAVFVNANKVEKDDPLRTLADKVVSNFDAGVEFLRHGFIGKEINNLGELIFVLVGNKVTPTILHPAIPTMGFAMANGKGLICIPPSWVNEVEKDRWFGYGSIVFCASQARDFVNRKLVDGKQRQVVMRARMYEAEYLCGIQRRDPSYKLHPYQEKVLADFPDGLRSPAAAQYKYTGTITTTIVPE